jgi:hypothetical protein
LEPNHCHGNSKNGFPAFYKECESAEDKNPRTIIQKTLDKGCHRNNRIDIPLAMFCALKDEAVARNKAIQTTTIPKQEYSEIYVN